MACLAYWARVFLHRRAVRTPRKCFVFRPSAAWLSTPSSAVPTTEQRKGSSAGRRQIIVWAYKSVAALDPATGRILWRQAVNAGPSYTVATPVWKEERLLLGGLMLKLNRDKPGASILWPEELRPARIHVSDTSTPLLQDGLVFSPTSKGQLLCLDAGTGKQLWQADQVTDLKGGASIHLTAVPSIRGVFL